MNKTNPKIPQLQLIDTVAEFLIFWQQAQHWSPAKQMQTGQDGRWQAWCQANLGWLAAEFLCRMDSGADLRPFFGSWYNLQGYKQIGYFLGHELIKMMCTQSDLREIALLDDINDR